MSEAATNSPWMTRKEASEYLRLDVSTIDKHLTPMTARRTAGKIRYDVAKLGGKGNPPIRLLAADVYAILPQPDEATPPAGNVVELKEAVNR